MKRLERIVSLLFLFALIGAIVVVIAAIASVNGMFVQWEKLGKPPETPVEVIRPGFVKTNSGNIYQQGCDSGCWEKIANIPPDTKTYWELNACGHLPSLNTYVDNKAVCEPWGVGTSLTIYAIGKDGFVYTWNHSLGEGTSMILFSSPFFGALSGFVIGVIIVLVGLFFNLLGWLRNRTTQKGM